MYSLFVDIGSVGESLVSSVAVVYGEECESSGAQGGYCGSSPEVDPVDIAAEIEPCVHLCAIGAMQARGTMLT